MLGDEGWHMIRSLKENGMRISDIARELNMDRKTVRKYARSKVVPKYKARGTGSKKINPYRDYIKGRIDKYNLSAVRILDEIRKTGYSGSYSTLEKRRKCRPRHTTYWVQFPATKKRKLIGIVKHTIIIKEFIFPFL